MTPRFEFQAQVEYDLGRPLTDAELQEASSLDQLSDDQIAVVAATRRHSCISPLVYVKAIVPTADHADVKKLIDEDIERIAIERRPPEELPNQHMFEHHAGRPLRPMERVRVESFEKMSNEQIELAHTLARADPTTCFLYLSRIVPGESTERRHELAKYFAETEDIHHPRDELLDCLADSNKAIFQKEYAIEIANGATPDVAKQRAAARIPAVAARTRDGYTRIEVELSTETIPIVIGHPPRVHQVPATIRVTATKP